MCAVAVVTGANRGIGREVVAQLAACGHTVVLGSRDPGKGERAAAAIDPGVGRVSRARSTSPTPPASSGWPGG